MAEIRVCGEGEIAEGGVRIVDAGKLQIGVIRQGGKYFAYRNRCPHQGGPACEGVRMPGVFDKIDTDGLYLGQGFDENDIHIVCPWHGYEYHLSDGTNVCDPKISLQKFEVIEREGAIYVAIDDLTQRFAALAGDLSALCTEAIEQDRLDDIPDDSLGQLFASIVRVHAAKAQNGVSVKPFGRNSGISVTDVAIGCTAMLDAVALSTFELGAWQALGGVGRPADHKNGPVGRDHP